MSYQEAWDGAAGGNWRDAILTNSNEETFERSGAHDAQLILEVYGKHGTTPLHGVMDFGCGAGRILKPLLLEHQVQRGVGVDISPRMLELTGGRIGLTEERLLLRRYDQRTINLAGLGPTEGIQLAYSWLCLQHMEYAHAFHALQEIRKALAPGGLFLGTFPNAAHPAYWRCITTHELHPWPLPAAHVRVYTTDFAALFLQQAGFEVIEQWVGNPDGAGGERATVSEAELLMVARRPA